jgi:hypothetical protein
MEYTPGNCMVTPTISILSLPVPVVWLKVRELAASLFEEDFASNVTVIRVY